MKTTVKYATLFATDEATGSLRMLDIRDRDGNLKSQLLMTCLKKELVRSFPKTLFYEVLQNRDGLLNLIDSEIEVGRHIALGICHDAISAALNGFNCEPSCDAEIFKAVYLDLLEQAGITEFYAMDSHSFWVEEFEMSYDEEKPEILLALLYQRKEAKRLLKKMDLINRNLNVIKMQ